MSAKTYWSKMTPEERSTEISRRMRKRKRTKELNKGAPRARNSSKEVASHHLAYIFGKVECIADLYADSTGVSRTALADGLAELFRRKAHG